MNISTKFQLVPMLLEVRLLFCINAADYVLLKDKKYQRPTRLCCQMSSLQDFFLDKKIVKKGSKNNSNSFE